MIPRPPPPGHARDMPLMLHPRAGLIAIVVIFAAAPALLSSYQLNLFTTGAAYSVGVLGVSLGLSTVGMLSLMQPAMMLIGGYVAVLSVERLQLGFLPAAIAAAASGIVVGVPLGWLTCKLDKYAFAILGFSFTYLVAELASSPLLVKLTGGELGRSFPEATLPGLPLQGGWGYGVVAVAVLTAFALAAVLFRSGFGRVLVAMEHDNVVAETVGANANSYRVTLAAVVSGIGGFGGAVTGLASGFIAPPTYDVSLSISLLVMALVGGTRYAAGPFVGAILLQVGPALLDLDQVDRNILVGLTLLVCLALLPNGLLSLFGAASSKPRGAAPKASEGQA